MKALPVLSGLGALALGFIGAVPAQEPVLVGGGYIPPAAAAPVAAMPAVVPVAVAPVAYVPVAQAAPIVYAPPVQIVSGGYYNSPNVIYFGGPNSCYYNTYPGDCYRPGCSYYSSSVFYFGRGEACERGYAFRHPR